MVVGERWKKMEDYDEVWCGGEEDGESFFKKFIE
jgi:hypothetical protein